MLSTVERIPISEEARNKLRRTQTLENVSVHNSVTVHQSNDPTSLFAAVKKNQSEWRVSCNDGDVILKTENLIQGQGEYAVQYDELTNSTDEQLKRQEKAREAREKAKYTATRFEGEKAEKLAEIQQEERTLVIAAIDKADKSTDAIDGLLASLRRSQILKLRANEQDSQGKIIVREIRMTYGETGLFDTNVMDTLCCAIVNKKKSGQTLAKQHAFRKGKNLSTKRNGDSASQMLYIWQCGLEDDANASTLLINQYVVKVKEKLKTIRATLQKNETYTSKNPLTILVLNQTCTIERMKILLKLLPISADKLKFVLHQSKDEKSKSTPDNRALMSRRFVSVLRQNGTPEEGEAQEEGSMAFRDGWFNAQVINFGDKSGKGRLEVEEKQLEVLIKEHEEADARLLQEQQTPQESKELAEFNKEEE